MKDIVTDFTKKAAKHWFDHATGKDLEDPKIYNNVRAVIRANFGSHSVWGIRMNGGGLDY